MAEPPYRPGDEIAIFQASHGRGVIVYGDRVEGIERRGDGWRITDSIGQQHDVPNSGMTGEVVPMDDLIRHDLKTRGQGHTAVREDMLREPPLLEQQHLPEQSLEQELDGGRDGIG